VSATAPVPTRDPLALYGAGIAGEAGELWARRPDGTRARLPLDRWLGALTVADDAVLDRALAPVLDIGCGPGRHVLALARRGLIALGIDVSPIAVAHARSRGAHAIEGSVFDGIPNAGRWGSALLLDGNVGIGGRPALLLRRLAQVVAPGGRVLVELEAPGVPTRRERLRLESGEVASDWFRWAHVGVDGIAAVAGSAGLEVRETWERAGRWFAVLDVP